MLTGWEARECSELTPVLPTARQKFLRHSEVYMEFIMVFKNVYVFTATSHGAPNDILWNPGLETLL
jgi:hypothetical protein